jgi:hypothetical protein
MDSKLRCVFIPAAEDVHTDSGTFESNDYSTAKTEAPAKAPNLSSSPKVTDHRNLKAGI